jgi:hypothetical protein
MSLIKVTLPLKHTIIIVTCIPIARQRPCLQIPATRGLASPR